MTRPAARSVLARSALLLAALLASACSLRPQPEPPPVEPGPQIDGDLLISTPDSASAFVGENIQGTAGACPAGALLRAYNLDSSAPSAEVLAASDGSFSLDLPVLVGDEVRLQAIVGGERSKPLDVVIGAETSVPNPAPHPLEDCLSVAPALELDLGQVGTTAVDRTLLIANGCSFEVTLGAVGMRAAVDGLTVEPPSPLPLPIASGASATVMIRYEAPTGFAGEAEDVLLIEIVAPEHDRRPVTIFAQTGS